MCHCSSVDIYQVFKKSPKKGLFKDMIVEFPMPFKK